MRERINDWQVFLLLFQLALSVAIGPAALLSNQFDEATASHSVSPPIVVITEAEIEASGAVVLGEVLDTMAGLEVLDKGYIESPGKVSFEGFAPDRMLYILDDEVINDPFGGSFDTNMIPLSAVERIEITRSGGYLQKGTRASGGTIRIITKGYEGGGPFSRLALAGGSYHASILGGAFRRGLSKDRIGISSSVSRISTSGFGDTGDYSLFQYHFRANEERWDVIDLGLSVSGTSSSLESAGNEGTTGEMKRGLTHLNARAVLMPGSSTPLEFSAFYSEHRRDSTDVSLSGVVSEIRGKRQGASMKGTFQVGPGLQATAGAEEEFLTVDGYGETETFSLFTGTTYDNAPFPALTLTGRWEREGSRYRSWNGALNASQSLNSSSSLYVSLWRTEQRPTIRERLQEKSGRIGEESVIETGLMCAVRDLTGSLALFRRWHRGAYSSRDSGGIGYDSLEAELREIGWRIQTSLGIGRILLFSLGYQGTYVQKFPDEAADVFVPRDHVAGTAEIHKSFRNDVIKCSCRVSGMLVDGRNQGGDVASTVDMGYRHIDTNLRVSVVDLTLFYNIRNVFDSRFNVVRGSVTSGRTNRFGFSWNFYD